jgi:hypothetical protein
VVDKTRETTLNIRWARLVSTDIDAAEDVLDWADWEESDWVASFIDEVKDGTHDEHISEIASAVQERVAFLTSGTAPKGETIKPTGPLGVYDIALGKQYQIRAGRRDRWEGVVVEILRRGRGGKTLKGKVMQEGFYPVKRGGTPITVGMVVSVHPQYLKPMGDVVDDTPKDICCGYTHPVTGVEHKCNTAVTVKGTACTACQVMHNRLEREKFDNDLAEQERARKVAAEAAKKAAAEAAEKEALKPGKRRVQRRGMR